MKPLYEVGDLVLVKDKYDQECDQYSYRCVFVDTMLRRYGGKVCTIKSVIEEGYNSLRYLPDDGYIYTLSEDTDHFQWTSSMFEPEF